MLISVAFIFDNSISRYSIDEGKRCISVFTMLSSIIFPMARKRSLFGSRTESTERMAPQKTVGQHVARGAAGAIRRQRSQINKHRSCAPARSRSRALVPTAERQQQQQQSGLESADEATRKFGLEAGLWSVFRGNSSNQSRTEQAKELLKVLAGSGVSQPLSMSFLIIHSRVLQHGLFCPCVGACSGMAVPT